MVAQDKKTTEANTRALRQLLKQPDNKVCADCKRNDPRWASWNIGAFLCIRCSGIHRSMGTHISKVKSVDLDAWTPVQLESIQKWGNRRANKYWEAHLKAGHIPPDHKMESFIRSKYETRRWAMEGSPPDDPSILDTDQPPSAEPVTEVQRNNPSQPAPVTQPQRVEPRHQLLSTTHLQQQPTQPRLQPPGPASVPVPAPAPAPAPAPPQNELFSLDFRAPSQHVQQQAQPAPPKNAKQDILSLFSTPAPNPVTAAPVQQSLWGQPQQPVQQQPVQGMMGQTGAGAWGVSSGWNAPQPQPQTNVWGNFTSAVSQQPQQPQQGSLGFGTQTTSNSGFGGFQQAPAFSTTDIWANNNTPTTTANNQKKDAFDDIWGGFK